MIEMSSDQQLIYYDEGADANSAAVVAAQWYADGYAAYDFESATPLIDLTGNGRNGALGAALPHAVGVGYTFNGSGYIITPIIPVPDQMWSMLISFAGIPAGNHSICGSRSVPGTSRFSLWPGFAGSRFYENGSFATGTISFAGNLVTGVAGFSGRTPYNNGVPEASLIPLGAGGACVALYIGCFSNDGVPLFFMTGGIIKSLIVYDHTRSPAQIAATTIDMPQ